ncbi:ATP-dependent DNA helicase RecG [Massilia sp. UYP11]|uniref:RNA-binding domain-containing protein n=1 Tax=Massilia sp. UYP11 TaxID=1756385 RepID=UPI003D25667C
MNAADLYLLVQRLLTGKNEHEWVEYKHNNVDPHMIGEYISALSNAAALDGEPFGYVLWGIEDGSQSVVGTKFNPSTAKGNGTQPLALWLNQYLRPKIDFRFEELEYEGKKLVVLRIPATVGHPSSFHEVEYIRFETSKVKLAMHPDKEARLWTQLRTRTDWSAELVREVTVDDLDKAALLRGRVLFAEKNPHLEAEMSSWNDFTFLSKLKVTKATHLTRAAVLLFGSEESAQYLPFQPQIAWILKDKDGTAVDYHHYKLPFLLVPDSVFSKVRNLTVRYMRPGTLFPTEVPQYDPWVIREALQNCIAHQDYALGARINVIEKPDELAFSNMGSFLPGKVELLLTSDHSPEQYRNPCLVQAMVSLKLIDTIGSGIRRMFNEQRKRFFPMPDYSINSAEQRVEVRVPGHIIDEKYTYALIQQPDLSLMDVVLLDRVQKHYPISLPEAKSLKMAKLIEGRAPNYFVSAQVASVIGEQAQYTLNKGLDNRYYRELVLQHLRTFKSSKRAELEAVLLNKLPEALTHGQKKNKVKNLLASMSKEGVLKTVGYGPGAIWQLGDSVGIAGVPTNMDKLSEPKLN